MHFYPTADINFYYDIAPSWSLYCHSPQKSWKRFPTAQASHTIPIFRDLEGATIGNVLRKHLHFDKQWPKSRIRYEACLPVYYAVGNRFIRLERAYPSGFKCAPMPISVKEVRAINAYYKKVSKEQARMQKSLRKDQQG